MSTRTEYQYRLSANQRSDLRWILRRALTEGCDGINRSCIEDLVEIFSWVEYPPNGED